MQKLIVILKGLREVCVAILMSVMALLGAALGITAMVGLYLVFVTIMPDFGLVPVPPQ